MSHVDRPVRWQEAAAGSVATVVLRSSTEQLLDDLERAVNDGVNTYKARPTAPSSSGCNVQQGQIGLHGALRRAVQTAWALLQFTAVPERAQCLHMA